MYQNRIVKTARAEAEKITGLLHFGLNEIKSVATSRFSSTKMQLSYEVVVPYDQQIGDDYCFLSFASINVNGRGSKSYGSEIARSLFDSFYEIEVKEDDVRFDANVSKRQILTGYDPLTLEASYLTIRFIEFAKENGVDLTEDEVRRFIPSSEKELNRLYYVHELRGSLLEEGDSFVMDNGYYRLKGRTDDCYELSCAIQLSHLMQTNTHFIVDSKERVWALQAVFCLVENVQAEMNEAYEFLVVSDNKLFKEIPLFGDKAKKERYIAYQNKLFAELPNKVYLLNDVEPEPVFETNLRSSGGYEGGIYSTVTIGGAKWIIVPYRFGYSFSTERGKADVVVANKSIYGIVGRYDNVGFIREHYGLDDWLVVGERPTEEHMMFYETFGDVPIAQYETLARLGKRIGQEVITMTFFDKEFESRKARYAIGDPLRVVKEIGPSTRVKGLEGVVIGLSRNKAKVEASFFGYFQGKFSLDQIEKIQEAETTNPLRLLS